MSRFIDQCIKWLAEMGVVVPDPGQYTAAPQGAKEISHDSAER